jgi:hypothetical protein
MWYAVHAIFYFELMNAEQESYLVHENVYLVSAATTEAAEDEAVRMAQDDEDSNVDGHLEVNGEKARYRFAGVRKIIEAQTVPGSDDELPISGREITYSVMEVDTLDEVKALAAGEMVNVLYRE